MEQARPTHAACCWSFQALAANITICARRRRIRGAVDDVSFVFRHEIQERPVCGVFTRGLLSFDAAANGIDGFSERILAHRPLHLTKFGRRRILQFRRNRGLRLDDDGIGRLARPGRCGSSRVSLRSRAASHCSPRTEACCGRLQPAVLPSSLRSRTWPSVSRHWPWMAPAPLPSTVWPRSCCRSRSRWGPRLRPCSPAAIKGSYSQPGSQPEHQ